MAVKLEEPAQNFYDRHTPCPEFGISRAALWGGIWDVVQNVDHFLQTAACPIAISLQGVISLESSSRYCLALMSNWNMSGFFAMECDTLLYIRAL